MTASPSPIPSRLLTDAAEGPIKRRDLIATLKTFGFQGPYKGSKHDHMVRGAQRLKIPNEHHQDISLDLHKRIVSEASIDPREWRDA